MLIRILLIFFVTVSTAYGEPPYPPSEIITAISWSANITRKAKGSDTWPVTWGEDSRLYTAFGDGWGFKPGVSEKLSLGFASVTGMAPNFSGVNIRSNTGEQKGDGPAGKKASGLLMVDGTIYMLVRNADNKGNQCQLAWSKNHMKTWRWSSWVFTEFGYCAFLNFGKNYSGSRDNYIYIYTPDTPNAYKETDHVVLMRVPEGQITNRDAYMFFSGFTDSGKPVWSPDANKRKSVFTYASGVNRLDVTYSKQLQRYLMTMRSRGKVGGEKHFSIYDAPEPWGPWTTVFFDRAPERWGESQHIPSKWIAEDGKSFYLLFSGADSFAVREAILTINRPEKR